jgi:hypothetical protein
MYQTLSLTDIDTRMLCYSVSHAVLAKKASFMGWLRCLTLPLSGGPQANTPGIPQKAALWAVRSSGLFGSARPCAYLLDHLVRLKQHARRDREPEGLGGLQ